MTQSDDIDERALCGVESAPSLLWGLFESAPVGCNYWRYLGFLRGTTRGQERSIHGSQDKSRAKLGEVSSCSTFGLCPDKRIGRPSGTTRRPHGSLVPDLRVSDPDVGRPALFLPSKAPPVAGLRSSILMAPLRSKGRGQRSWVRAPAHPSCRPPDPGNEDDVDALFTRLEPVPPGVLGLL